MTICKIKTLKNNIRMSTQELLQTIEKKIENGHTEFEIEACGQHDIGGSSWTKNGKNLLFNITNPGQRVGVQHHPDPHLLPEQPAHRASGGRLHRRLHQHALLLPVRAAAVLGHHRGHRAVPGRGLLEQLF